MDIQVAADLLEIDLLKPLNIEIIKKQYHKLALQTHPDKNNNSPESTERFKLINDAYQCLLENNANNSNNLNNFELNNNFEYILRTFLNSIVIDEAYKEIIISIINDIVTVDLLNISIKLFEKLNKEQSIEVYEILCKYKSVFFVSQDIIDKVKKIIQEKFVNDIYIINPTLDDLFNNNIYILTLECGIYYVPLWHEELCFDNKSDNKCDMEMIVKCMPDLPDNVSIDEDNNVCVKLNIAILNILNKNTISFKLGVNQFDICIGELKFKKIQYYTFKEMGISKINETNIYHIFIKTDIIVMITFI